MDLLILKLLNFTETFGLKFVLKVEIQYWQSSFKYFVDDFGSLPTPHCKSIMLS